MKSDAQLLAVAQNIINQLADVYAEEIPSDKWVAVRQATNDAADQFVLRLLREVQR